MYVVGSFEHPKQMFKLMNHKLFTILQSKLFFISTNDILP